MSKLTSWGTKMLPWRLFFHSCVFVRNCVFLHCSLFNAAYCFNWWGFLSPVAHGGQPLVPFILKSGPVFSFFFLFWYSLKKFHSVLVDLKTILVSGKGQNRWSLTAHYMWKMENHSGRPVLDQDFYCEWKMFFTVRWRRNGVNVTLSNNNWTTNARITSENWGKLVSLLL